MSFSLNRVQLIGNLGTDAEHRFTQNNTSVTSFSLATTETWKDKNTGDKMSETEWHDCVAFGLPDWFKDQLKKGTKWYVEGKKKTELWTDKEGVKRKTVRIQVNKFNGLIPLSEANNNTTNADNNKPVAQTDNTDDDSDSLLF